MKNFIIITVLIISLTLILPSLIIKLPKNNNSSENDGTLPHTEHHPEKTSEKINVYIKNQDCVVQMDTLQYLKEVVSAEMPADFHPEALKAQAVAARTYMLNRKNAGATDIHKGADICTDSTHCKAWISEQDRKNAWGEDAEKNWQKISDAVESTDNTVITYEGKLISAVFHSTSSGQTENAADVWGGNVPYLVSVNSVGDINSPKYNSSAEYSTDDFKKLCETNLTGTNWNMGLFSDIVRSEAGGIISIKIGGVTVKGTDLRNIFSLRSTNVDIKHENDKVIMTVKGYGHGVGMSQYGANYLACQGMGYVDILKTYYTGVEVVNMANIEK